MTLENMKTYISGLGYDWTVTGVVECSSENEKGYLVTVNIPDYGEGIEYYIPEKRDISGIINNSGMPPEYMSKTAKDFKFDLYDADMTKVKQIVNAAILSYQDFVKQGRGLYIFSNTKGSGKTMLSCVIANEILKRNQTTCKFVTVTDYVEMYRAKDPMLDRIRNATLLIVDDLGVQDESKDWINEIVYSLVDLRYRNMCCTIYTSNRDFTEKDIAAEDRTASRIYGSCVPVQLPGVSIRANMADAYRHEFVRGAIESSSQPGYEPIF